MSDRTVLAPMIAAITLVWFGAFAAAAALAVLGVVVAVVLVRRGRWQAAPAVAVSALALVAAAFRLQSRPGCEWLAAMAALVALGLWLMPVPRLPRPSGPHRVGLSRVVVGDPTRSRHWPPSGEGDERILVYAWYPAKPGPGSRPRFYHSAIEDRAFASFQRAVGAPDFLNAHYRLCRTHSHEDAPVSDHSQAYPVLVFSHGGGCWPTQNFALMEALASHGYTVLSVTHPHESSGVVWPDGTITPVHPEVVRTIGATASLSEYWRFALSHDYGARLRAWPGLVEKAAGSYVAAASKRWRDDCLMVARAFRQGGLAGMAGDIAARSDPSRVGYFGMSLGGSAAYGCCHADPIAKAGANLDGALWDFELMGRDAPTPFLHIASDPALAFELGRRLAPDALADVRQPRAEDPRAPQASDFFYEPAAVAGLRRDIVRLTAPGAAHMSFTDLVLAGRRPILEWLKLGRVDGGRMTALLNDLCVSFFDCHLKGEGDFSLGGGTEGRELVGHDLSSLRLWAAGAPGRAIVETALRARPA